MTRVDMFCGSCRFWDQRYPANTDLGVCLKAGVLLFEREAAIVMLVSYDSGPATSDVEAVRTPRHFGCIEHTQQHTLLKTLETARPGEGAQ